MYVWLRAQLALAAGTWPPRVVTYRNRCILKVFSWWLEAYESQARECRNDNRRRTWIRCLSQPCTRFLGQMVACVILSIDTTKLLVEENRLNYLAETPKENCNTLKEQQDIIVIDVFLACLCRTMYCSQASFVVTTFDVILLGNLAAWSSTNCNSW